MKKKIFNNFFEFVTKYGRLPKLSVKEERKLYQWCSEVWRNQNELADRFPEVLAKLKEMRWGEESDVQTEMRVEEFFEFVNTHRRLPKQSVKKEKSLYEWCKDVEENKHGLAERFPDVYAKLKVYLQHNSKGVMFIGGMIKPGRKYESNRTVGDFYKAIYRFNKIAQGGMPAMMKNAELFRDVMNSYFGILGNFDEKRLTVKMIYRIDKNWYKLMTVKMKDHKCKVVLRKNVVMQLKTKKKENFEFENL